jgi:hypothetical protein
MHRLASDEAAQRSLMLASLAGEARGHRALLNALLQMTFIAVHERRDT